MGGMPFEVEVTEEAETDLDSIKPFYRKQILDAMDTHLCYAPERTSRSRIKRLRSVDSPGYRLRVGDFRVFYDVDMQERCVTILRVLSKEDALRYLKESSHEDPED
jgi:mRNA-degrading endonuclease RelE of RelBE toxin-antitoxin system